MNAAGEERISHLISALAQRRLYDGAHLRVRSAAEEFVRALEQHHKAEHRRAFFLGVAESRLIDEGLFVFGSSVLGAKLTQLAQRCQCGGFLFPAETTVNDVLAFLDFAVEVREELASLAEARARLAAKTATVQLSPPYEDPGWFGQFLFNRTEQVLNGAEERRAQELLPVYQSLFDSVEQAHEGAASGAGFDVDNTRGITEGLLDAAQGAIPDMLRLVHYPTYDSYTVGHSVRVALLAIQTGLSLGLPQHVLIELGTAGLLHDIGKSQIPDEILFKPGRLDDEERATMSQHTRLGAEILVANGRASPLSVGAAWGHHLREDGGGYPAQREWAAIGRSTQLIHVCDVFEALTAVRPYKLAMSPRTAYEIMFSDRGCFHPGALRSFVRAIGIYPPGSRVKLTSGETALVVAAGEELDRPSVSVTHDARGEARAPEARDLASEEWRRLSIVKLLPDIEAAAAPGLHSLGLC